MCYVMTVRPKNVFYYGLWSLFIGGAERTNKTGAHALANRPHMPTEITTNAITTPQGLGKLQRAQTRSRVIRVTVGNIRKDALIQVLELYWKPESWNMTVHQPQGPEKKENLHKSSQARRLLQILEAYCISIPISYVYIPFKGAL